MNIFLEYLKKKQVGLIDETNINVHYEKELDDVYAKVGRRLNKFGYEITEQDKSCIIDILVNELLRIKEGSWDEVVC